MTKILKGFSAKVLLLFFTVFLGISLSGCKDEEVAPMVLPQFNQYFPGSTIYEADKRFLWIQTNVDGISSSLADLMFKQDCGQALTAIQQKSFGLIKNLPTALTIAGKQVLIIGFKNFWVVWVVRNGIDTQGNPYNYQVLNYEQFSNWLIQVLGAVPTPDQINVVTLDNIQSTPKGQPVISPSLAQVRQQEGQVPLQTNPTFAE